MNFAFELFDDEMLWQLLLDAGDEDGDEPDTRHRRFAVPIDYNGRVVIDPVRATRCWEATASAGRVLPPAASPSRVTPPSQRTGRVSE